MYPVRYQVGSDDQLPSMTRLSGADVPCSLCQATDAVAVLVQAGTQDCRDDPKWQQLYSGYLFAAKSNEHKGSFICVDGHAEAANASRGGGASIYPVETDEAINYQGAASYHIHQELTCSVCMRRNDCPPGEKDRAWQLWGVLMHPLPRSDVLFGRRLPWLSPLSRWVLLPRRSISPDIMSRRFFLRRGQRRSHPLSERSVLSAGLASACESRTLVRRSRGGWRGHV